MRSEPEVPVIESSPSVPIMKLALGKLVLVSVPKISATVSAAMVINVLTLPSKADCNVDILCPLG